MIQIGSKVILRTNNAIFDPCFIQRVDVEPGRIQDVKSVTVTYFAGYNKDKNTGEMHEDWKVETIQRKDMVSIAERI